MATIELATDAQSRGSALAYLVHLPHKGPWTVTKKTYYESSFTIKCPSMALSAILICQLGLILLSNVLILSST